MLLMMAAFALDEQEPIVGKYKKTFVIGAHPDDMVITHWPIDAHRDHRVCSVLAYGAWRLSKHSLDLYYGEVMTGMQTLMLKNGTKSLGV